MRQVVVLILLIVCVVACAADIEPTGSNKEVLSSAVLDGHLSFHPTTKDVRWLVVNRLCFSNQSIESPGCDLAKMFGNTQVRNLKCLPNKASTTRIGAIAECGFEIIHRVESDKWDLYCQDTIQLEYTTWWDEIAQYYGWELAGELVKPRRTTLPDASRADCR